MKNRHLHAVIATIKVAVPFSPDDNLMLLTTQIKEQARKLTGFVSCETMLGKIPAPATVEAVEPVDEPVVEPAPHPLDLPASLKK